MSTKAIGAAVGVSDTTVVRDLSTASPEAEAEIIGVNGKRYEPSGLPPGTPRRAGAGTGAYRPAPVWPHLMLDEYVLPDAGQVTQGRMGHGSAPGRRG